MSTGVYAVTLGGILQRERRDKAGRLILDNAGTSATFYCTADEAYAAIGRTVVEYPRVIEASDYGFTVLMLNGGKPCDGEA